MSKKLPETSRIHRSVLRSQEYRRDVSEVFEQFLHRSRQKLSPSPLWKLIMRHIFWTGHGGREVLFCQRGRLWTNVFGTNHQVHSSDDRARAAALACGVVAPGLWETELAQSQR